MSRPLSVTYALPQMISTPTLVLAGLSAVSLVLGQRNVTVVNTDPSIKVCQILIFCTMLVFNGFEYEGKNTGDAPICKLNPNGTYADSRPGCYLLGPATQPCAESFTVGRGSDSAASLTFKGWFLLLASGLSAKIWPI